MYSGAKGAIDSFTKCWVKKLAKDKVRVNAISPGTIETDIWNKANIPKDLVEKYKGQFIKKFLVKDLLLLKKLLMLLYFQQVMMQAMLMALYIMLMDLETFKQIIFKQRLK